MSTRSGRRIHKYSHESPEEEDAEMLPKSERKTRNKRYKENNADDFDITLPKSRTRQNYVSYPSENIQVSQIARSEAPEVKSTRKTKKRTLKENNTNVFEVESMDGYSEGGKALRVTRQTKKFSENAEDTAQCLYEQAQLESEVNKKTKKNKKKKSKNSDIDENITETLINGDTSVKDVFKKSNKKKKKKGKTLNGSHEGALNQKKVDVKNVSSDSFHSATGSPLDDPKLNSVASNSMQVDITLRKKSYDETDLKSLKNGTLKISTLDVAEEVTTKQNDTFEQESNKSRKSVTKNTHHISEVMKNLNSTFEKTETVKRDDMFTPIKNSKPRRSSRANNSLEKHEAPEIQNIKINLSFDKNEFAEKSALDSISKKKGKSRKSVQSTQADADDIQLKCNNLNTSFEKPTTNHESKATLENSDSNDNFNTTFEKTRSQDDNKAISLDSTFDKSTPKLNSTYDKNEIANNSKTSEKNSLISSDGGTINVTYDKDDDDEYRISITSDESKTDNIVNTTPVLIESSMDESCLLTTSIIKEKDSSPTPITKETLQVPVTSLKREGTFTKEGPDVKFTEHTPSKNSLPSPGCTPFHTSRSSQKSVMNVTKSLEKSLRRSSLVEVAPRQTKVMFCSPMNSSSIINQQKRTVIKSSLKGSNKSFVLDDNASSSVKPAARKRSYTHNDVEDTRAKRKRLADDLQQSVVRLSRPRTPSIPVPSASRPTEATPSKRAPTPSKKSEVKRTRLPNFAALHQREFAKMESLGECQARRALRARALLTPLTPTASASAASPTATTEPVKPKESAKQLENSTTPSHLTKVPTTLESLRPGYTRFGFKMNYDVNPFSIPSKSDKKTTKKSQKPNGLNKTKSASKISVLPTLEKPSLRGAATSRKEAAKQTVMREKSFTSLSSKRDVKRNENRTVIEGVRTNRRFDLLMQMRKID